MTWPQTDRETSHPSFDSISHDKTTIVGLAQYYTEHETAQRNGGLLKPRDEFSSKESGHKVSEL